MEAGSWSTFDDETMRLNMCSDTLKTFMTLSRHVYPTAAVQASTTSARLSQPSGFASSFSKRFVMCLIAISFIFQSAAMTPIATLRPKQASTRP